MNEKKYGVAYINKANPLFDESDFGIEDVIELADNIEYFNSTYDALRSLVENHNTGQAPVDCYLVVFGAIESCILLS